MCLQSRKLDVYFEYEEKLMSKSTLDKSLLDIISDPDGTNTFSLTHTHIHFIVIKGHQCVHQMMCYCRIIMSERLCLSAGTPEDKMRLFLIYYIAAQQAPSEVTH